VQAKRIIEQEHRSLAAVLHGMLFVVREIRYGGSAANFDLLFAMVDYLENFSEKVHHPKEDAYLFERVAARCEGAGPTIERLREQHRAGGEKIDALKRSLARYQEQGDPAFADFAAQVAGFAAFHWDHMRTEEDVILPLALAHLSRDDWALIDRAFLGHADPLLGVERGDEYQALFKRIVELAPPPLGLAPRR
jgi:branched-chain amino acid transport system ATP-binding protein